MTLQSYRIAVKIILIFWTLLVLYGSLAPGDDLPLEAWWSTIPHFDKLVHFGFYFVETVLLLLVFYDSRISTKILLILSVVAFSGLIEIVQGAFFDRSRDLADMAANSLGVLCAPGAAMLVHRLVGKVLGFYSGR